MTEILTESFCERCGTRYTFESARPKKRLKGVRVISRGLKNFVLSDDTSMNEAMAAARSEAEREATSHQLDAFHKTFTFCMSCRQYTCPNCWNGAEARCLSCAPLVVPETPGALDDLTSLSAAILAGETVAGNGTSEHEHDPRAVGVEAEAEAGPEAEAGLQAEAEAVAVAGPEAEAEARLEAETEAEVEPEIEPVKAVDEPGKVESVATQAEELDTFRAEESATVQEEPIAAEAPALDLPSAEPAVGIEAIDPGEKATQQTASLLRRFRPGENLDAELDAYERERADAEAPGTEAPVDPASAAAAEPGSDAAESAPTPEPEAAPLAAAAASDVIEQPTWRITAHDVPGATPPGPHPEGAAAVPLQASASATEAPPAEPQWPAKPEWPSSTPTAGLPFLGRSAAPQGGIDALWAASNQEVIATPPAPGRPAPSGIQPCVSCGLSLSANARFCRRCGTLQQR